MIMHQFRPSGPKSHAHARHHVQGASPLHDRAYACAIQADGSGRIRTKTEMVDGRRIVHHYSYDAAGRLTRVTRNGQVTEQYAYDDQGRRAMDLCPHRGLARRRHEYGPDDRLLGAGNTRFEYDAMGRLTRRKESGKEDFICMYAPQGFLGATRLPDMRWVSFDRDGEGRRTAKKIDNQKVEGYGWDKQGRLMWFFDDLARETSWFEYGDDEARLPLSMQRGGQRYDLGWDHLGSLRAVIDPHGRVVKEVEYDAFGNILKETAPEFKIPFGFAGGLYDRDTNMIRYRFRDYLPDTGRFTAKDPIGYKGGDSDLYGYCLDDPVNGIDPSGLISLDALAGTKHGAAKGQVKSVRDGNQRLAILDPLPDAGDWPESAAHRGLEGVEMEQALPKQNEQHDLLALNPELREDAERVEQMKSSAITQQDTHTPTPPPSEPEFPEIDPFDYQAALATGREGEELARYAPSYVSLPNDPLGIQTRAEAIAVSDERERWDPRNQLESQLNFYGLSMSDATAMGWSHKDIQEYVAFMDHITNLKVDRDADQPFLHIRIADSWEDLPEVIRNFEPQTTWGNIGDDMGDHPLNQRLPGGYHVTLESGRNAGVWVHLDVYDQLEPGIISGLTNLYKHSRELNNPSIFIKPNNGHGGAK